MSYFSFTLREKLRALHYQTRYCSGALTDLRSRRCFPHSRIVTSIPESSLNMNEYELRKETYSCRVLLHFISFKYEFMGCKSSISKHHLNTRYSTLMDLLGNSTKYFNPCSHFSLRINTVELCLDNSITPS